MLLNSLTVGEIFSVGGLTALIGIGVTFLTLCLLVFALIFMDKGMKFKFPNRLKSESNTIKDNALTQNIQPEMVPQDQTKNNSQIIAAIMAAITAVIDSENKQQNKAKASFVVKSIKRI